jgi:hypothetical protein
MNYGGGRLSLQRSAALRQAHALESGFDYHFAHPLDSRKLCALLESPR